MCSDECMRMDGTDSALQGLARLGANVTGIDPSRESVGVATAHANLQPHLASQLEYRHTDVETLQAEGELSTTRLPLLACQGCTATVAWHAGRTFDAVIASEVVEHVDDVRQFTKTLGALTRDKGLVVMSTLNRTMRSYLTAIIGAEQISRIIPPGTHTWTKFLTPGVLACAQA